MLLRSAIVLTLAASVGWVVPLFFVMWFMLDCSRLEAAPSVYGHERVESSFPFVAAAAWIVNAGAPWAAGAVAVWLVLGLRYVASGLVTAEPLRAADSR